MLGRSALMAAADRRRERPYGIHSNGAVELDELTIDSEHRAAGFPYVASPGLLVDTLLANVPGDLRRCSFVDFGSGKGRVLLLAAHHPFRQVIGVEFSPELHRIAEDNIRRYTSPRRRCREVRSVCADAAGFPLPDGDCVLYFNNPFAEPVFERVLERIGAAHAQGGRRLWVLYQQLAGDLESDRADNVALLRRAPFLRERPVRFPSVRARLLLGSHELRVFEGVSPPAGSSGR